MIVIGVDPHKQTHTAAAVDRSTGELLGELTVRGNEEGHGRLLEWARALAGERGFALEDCRQVSVSAGALSDRPWRAGGAGAAEADGRGAPGGARQGQVGRDRRAGGRACGDLASPTLPAAQLEGGLARAAAAGRPPRGPGLRADPRSRTGCAGTCTSSTPSSSRPGPLAPMRAALRSELATKTQRSRLRVKEIAARRTVFNQRSTRGWPTKHTFVRRATASACERKFVGQDPRPRRPGSGRRT